MPARRCTAPTRCARCGSSGRCWCSISAWARSPATSRCCRPHLHSSRTTSPCRSAVAACRGPGWKSPSSMLTGSRLPAGETGEICVRGPGGVRWLSRQSRGDGEGFRAMAGFTPAISGISTRAGFSTSPAARPTCTSRAAPTCIRARSRRLLLTHPAVAEACVLGLPHPKWGESGVAVVVRRRGRRSGRGVAGASRRPAGAIQMAAAFRGVARAAEIRLRQGDQARRARQAGGRGSGVLGGWFVCAGRWIAASQGLLAMTMWGGCRFPRHCEERSDARSMGRHRNYPMKQPISTRE